MSCTSRLDAILSFAVQHLHTCWRFCVVSNAGNLGNKGQFVGLSTDNWSEMSGCSSFTGGYHPGSVCTLTAEQGQIARAS